MFAHDASALPVAYPAGGVTPGRKPSGALVIGFVLFVIACQLALLVPAAGDARVFFRSAAFAGSIALAVLLPGAPGTRLHPATPWALFAIVVVGLGLFHPQTNTLLAGAATLCMYFAIVAPMLWVARLQIDARMLKRVILTIWAFNAISAFVGVLQTSKPDWQWLQPNLSAVVENTNAGGETLKVSLASGARVFRPMGLSDMPGAAASAGLACIVFGAALMTSSRNQWLWAACCTSMAMGLYCILLSQVRSILVMTVVCVLAFAGLMVRRKAVTRLTHVMIALCVVAVLACAWAIAVGGESVTERLRTLVAQDPGTVYYQNRGHYLHRTFAEHLPAYPLGAGLGRWGMMNYYFGNPDNDRAPSLWAEIMWTSWVYDGGFPLMAAYVIAIAIALWYTYRLARDRHNGELGLWAAVIGAFNIGCIAVTFNYPLFMGQSGMDFWLLNAALFAAAQTQRRNASRPAAVALPATRPATSDRPPSLLDMNT